MTGRTWNRHSSIAELVERFNAIALSQHEALWKYQTARYNRLFDQMLEIENELRSREGDQRRALLPLLDSRDVHVRLKAGIALLAVAPNPARKALASVRDYGLLPQAADASSMLRALEEGTYVPS